MPPAEIGNARRTGGLCLKCGRSRRIWVLVERGAALVGEAIYCTPADKAPKIIRAD